MKTILFFLFFAVLGVDTLQGQSLKGQVTDVQGVPIFGAYLYCIKQAQQGTHSGLDGTFTLPVCPEDSLFCSFLGYEKQVFGPEIWSEDSILIILKETALTMDLVEVLGKDPVLEDFSVKKLERLDVYQNPLAAGDVLKALSSLPASTTLDETANPSLRGSDPDRSRVVLNGVPIYQPVRNSQLNGLGNFSLFNTEIIQREYVYASNPPLSVGNTSAGLVELETIDQLENRQFNIGLSLANLGFLYGQNLRDKGLVQVYGNYQFSKPFLWANPLLEGLNSFGNTDLGIHARYQLTDHWATSFFLYAIQESYSVNVQVFDYSGASEASSRRLFAINSWEWSKGNQQLAVRMGVDRQGTDFSLGILQSEGQNQRQYYGVQYRWWPRPHWNVQVGADFQAFKNASQDTFPVFFYAYQPGAPLASRVREEHIVFGELYAVAKRNWGERWSLGVGSRANVFSTETPWYVSAQAALRFQPKAGQRWLLSAGQYHSVATSNALRAGGSLLKSQQLALDYEWEANRWTWSTAIYAKNDQGGDPQRFVQQDLEGTRTWGLELGGQYEWHRFWRGQVSYTFLEQQQISLDGTISPGPRDLRYFIRGTLEFNHPRWLNASIFVLGRDGQVYTPVIDGLYQPAAKAFAPVYSPALNSRRYEDYWSVGINLSKMWILQKCRVLAFLNVSNALNRANQRGWILQGNYRNQEPDLFQLRTLYFGTIWSLLAP